LDPDCGSWVSFQEFLAGEECAKQRQHLRLVREFGRSWWREPTVLALGLDEPRFQDALFRALIRSGAFGGNLDLALHCVREAFALDVKPFRQALGAEKIPWEARYNCVLMLREMGGPEAVAVLELACRDSDPRVADAAAEALAKLGGADVAAGVRMGVEVRAQVAAKDGSELVKIPAGEFLAGSSEGEGDADERPQRQVHVDEFFMAKNPVTNAQYARFLKETGHGKPHYWSEKRLNKPNQPVVGVTWHDAQAYCEWASLRLPTEAEWEKAARGTDGRQYPWGNEPSDERRCNFGNNVGATTEVGSYPEGASPYGCLDMAGNVWEWCQTKWRNSYDAPEDSSPGGRDRRVLRGGAWYSDADGVRCAYRYGDDPDNRGGYFGFRCAR
jgi:formylglycine-generating enzyme required for sulfatase activity